MNYATTTSTFAPQQVPNTQGMFNTALANAQAAADPRFNMKAMDRNGVSRGKGTMATAGIQAAQNLADGIAQAYRVPAQDASTISSIAQQNDYANAMAALQRNQNVLNFQGNALGGLLGSIGNTSNLGSFGNYNGTYRF
jgi:hypothetical protein